MSTDSAELPDELPPVQPPSAGFILQLFVVPGVIVMAVVAVWLLFGKLATSEQDWHGLVRELQQPNQHRRWRGALGLAQILKSDLDSGDMGQHLASNLELARTLSDVLHQELRRGSQEPDSLKYQSMLARTLGMFDLPEIVTPPLREAIQTGHDRDVRKDSLAAVAVLLGRLSEHGQPVHDDDLFGDLVQISTDDDPLIRQLGAFTLGLADAETARLRLAVMLDDADANTRINAAIGLARQKDLGGYRVLRDILKSGSAPHLEQYLATLNGLAAIKRLAGQFSAEQRSELSSLIEPFAASSADPRLRIDAKQALQALNSAASPAH
ncbi:MAG: hypothetical protein HZA46_25375 [Planctomycetales bacterium]|nr:hypothetical protein [Planctomycetales bacterium]